MSGEFILAKLLKLADNTDGFTNRHLNLFLGATVIFHFMVSGSRVPSD